MEASQSSVSVSLDSRIVAQQKLYHLYAQAAETYVRKPTLCNWEKKEEAFEVYSDSLVNITEAFKSKG